MTLRAATEITPPAGSRNIRIYQWREVDQNDTCEAISLADYADRSIQVEGTFGSGDTVAVQGSNDGTNYRALADTIGDEISITAVDIVQIGDLSAYLKPVPGGSSGSVWTITLVARKN